MGDEESAGGNSVGASCATPLINWWDVQATSSLSSWNTTHSHAPPNHDSNSSSCCDEVHHHLSVSSDNHLWTQVLLGVGSNEEVQNREEAGGENNLMDEMSSKSIMYEPTSGCSNYLKKLDTTWDYNHSSSSSSINTCSTTTFDRKYPFNPNTTNNDNNGFNDDEAMLESSERFTNTWSIAPPKSHHIINNTNNNNTQFDPPPPHHHHQTHNHNNDNNLNSCMDHFGGLSSYGSPDMKAKQQHHLHHHDAASEELLGYQNKNGGFNNNNHHYGMMPTSLSRNLTDVISFTGRIGRPIIGVHALKSTFRPPSFMTTLADHHSKKHLFHTSSVQTRTSNGRGQGSSTEVKKKRTDHDPSSQPILKKQKQDTTSSNPSSTKVQAPKVKLGDRITALQQIVSPFGKTDTASVLFEAIGYIKFLQEQVQLLSNSYMKANSHRETTWGNMERKDEKGDLKSRGLCLVPISWTPQAYRDNTAPDYWTPAYRGCLFR